LRSKSSEEESTTMDALDGNAIAGELYEVFGEEMTMAIGTCAHCGATGVIAEQRVYLRAPGTVARCPRCNGVTMVLVSVRGSARIDLAGFELAPPHDHGTPLDPQPAS
jgi:ribosomal protein S27AE